MTWGMFILLKPVILLNGPSSSGKSTLGRALQAMIQERKNERFGLVSIDDCMKLAADEVIYEDDVFEINPDLCEKALCELKYAAGVIIDHVITSERIYTQLTEALKPYALIRVKVTCPPDELQRREIARGDRHPGSAQASYTWLYPKDGYDLTVDTYAMTTAQCADIIFAELEKRTAKRY